MKIDINDVQPVGKRCLINTFKEAKQTEAGFYKAEKDYEATPVIGTVVRAGTESAYKEGDVVMFRRYSLDELKFNSGAEDVIFNLVEDEEVTCIVKSTV